MVPSWRWWERHRRGVGGPATPPPGPTSRNDEPVVQHATCNEAGVAVARQVSAIRGQPQTSDLSAFGVPVEYGLR